MAKAKATAGDQAAADQAPAAPAAPDNHAAADPAATDQGQGADTKDADDGGNPDPGDAPPAKKVVAFVAEANGNVGKKALALLLDACELYGVNPEQDQRPVELQAWKFRDANPVEQLPASVTLVTAGGLKIVHYADPSYPMDPETEERLRLTFGAFRRDKDGTRVPLPLPTDLTLPEGAVTGLAKTDSHVYRQGYLRDGGRAEAERRGRR